MKYPKKLVDNDTVGITAISLSANLEKISLAEENLKKYGFNIIETSDVRNEAKNFVSASDSTRAEEFIKIYLDNDIKHIIAARGGEFAIDIIPYLHKYKEDINNCNVVNGFAQLANTANNIASIPAKFPANK